MASPLLGFVTAVACPWHGSGSLEAGPHVPTAFFWDRRAVANPLGGKDHFYSQQIRVPGRVLSCHSLSQPHLSLGIWFLRNYCKRNKALGKARLRGFFQVIFSKAFFIFEDSGGPVPPSCCQHYVAKPRHEVVGEG